MQGANLGATKQSKFFADPELTEISMRLYVPLLENDLMESVCLVIVGAGLVIGAIYGLRILRDRESDGSSDLCTASFAGVVAFICRSLYVEVAT